jgi:hypothetical protein
MNIEEVFNLNDCPFCNKEWRPLKSQKHSSDIHKICVRCRFRIVRLCYGDGTYAIRMSKDLQRYIIIWSTGFENPAICSYTEVFGQNIDWKINFPFALPIDISIERLKKILTYQ